MDLLNKDTYSRIYVVFVPDRSWHDVTVLLSMTWHGCVRLTAQCTTFVAPSDKGSYETKRPPFMGGSRGGGDKGSGPHWNCQITNFCHVEIFRQTPSGNLPPPPPPRENFLDPRMPLISEWSFLKIQILYFMLYGKHCKLCKKDKLKNFIAHALVCPWSSKDKLKNFIAHALVCPWSSG